MRTEASNQLTYFVSGMWCASCSKNVGQTVRELPGVVAADVNYASKLLSVRTDRSRTPSEIEELDKRIQDQVDRIGFGIKKQSEGWITDFRRELEAELDSKISWTTIAVVWFLAMWSSMWAFAGYAGGGLSTMESYALSVASAAFGLPAILIGLVPYARAGWRALRFNRQLTLDLIIVVGGVSAFSVTVYSLLSHRSISYADSGSMIVAILLLTKKIENTVVKKVTSSILSQLQTGQKSVQVWKTNAWQGADVAQIRRGDRLLVRADEIVPFDGHLTTVNARVNAHLLNGENHPQLLNAGDDLFAGVIALTDLEMTVSQPLGFRRIDTWAETALAGHARTSLSPYTRFFSRIEGVLTSVALGGASMLAVFAWYQGAGAGHVAESFFIGVLVFCPCLFASILPLTKQLVHLGLLRAGIVTSRSEALLDLCHIQNFYFDKTGTLEAVQTAYQDFHGTAVVPAASLREISKRSAHPLLRELTFPEVTDDDANATLKNFEEVPGQGIVATTEGGDTIVIGRADHLQKCGVHFLAGAAMWDRDFPGVALNGQLVGQILVKKTYDEKSKRFLQQLTETLPGTRIQILSGDTGADAGRELATAGEGISYHGSMTPEQKAAAIPRASAFVGDGLNDTLALAKADVSFRLGQRAAGFAPVDFHLQVPNLDLLFRVIQYGRKYRRVLWQTAAAAFIYNIIAITLAALGFFSPLGAVLAMLGSFTILLLSSLRLWKVDEVHT